MKKSFKRTVSLFLCLAMVFCIPAFAAEEDVNEEHDGHDCAEHEVVLSTNDLQSTVEAGIMAAVTATCAPHTYVQSKTVKFSMSTTTHQVMVAPNGATATCTITGYGYSYTFTCTKCQEFYILIDSAPQEFSHSISAYH